MKAGPLGGNVNTASEVLEFKYFRPNYHKRNVIAMRILGSFETGYGGKVIPPFSRFYLGGEDTLRGFDIRTVSPVVFVPTLVEFRVIPTRILRYWTATGQPTAGVVSHSRC